MKRWWWELVSAWMLLNSSSLKRKSSIFDIQAQIRPRYRSAWRNIWQQDSLADPPVLSLYGSHDSRLDYEHQGQQATQNQLAFSDAVDHGHSICTLRIPHRGRSSQEKVQLKVYLQCHQLHQTSCELPCNLHVVYDDPCRVRMDLGFAFDRPRKSL